MTFLTTNIMKRHTKEPITLLWLLFLMTSLLLVYNPAHSSAATLGEESGGGVVFYIDASRKHGLIAARSDMKGHSPGFPEGFFTWEDAQVACKKFESCDYRDWFLPNKDQLNKLYLHRSALEQFPLSYSYYWSSSEDGAGHAWVEGFGLGFQVLNFKTNSNRVRAVRAF
ncbi:MAG: DUF1566 domain-containing protein [Chlorobium sp.]|nr:MAG: DUF1566 domain-containing protein [Chlorobium sp.]